MKRKISLLLICLSLVACGAPITKSEHHITVTIAPLSWVVSGLTGGQVDVSVIVPPGTSPETYEPTARQSEDLSRSDLIFSIGLVDIERQLEGRLREMTGSGNSVFVRLADSLSGALAESVCADHHHHDAPDPHVWLSPRMMREMTIRAANYLIAQSIDQPERIVARRDSLCAVIDSVDHVIRQNLSSVLSRAFAIVHPSLGYFARDYGLTQLSIEVQGKEPTGRRIRDLVDTLRAKGVKTIIYSAQDPSTAARVIATEIGAQVVSFDPMAVDWAANMVKISEIVCQVN
ncbi:MAG: zinc ABC transporter substrate-binding protein [Mucinivorans sp.]